jgi:hypothetical protein
VQPDNLERRDMSNRCDLLVREVHAALAPFADLPLSLLHRLAAEQPQQFSDGFTVPGCRTRSTALITALNESRPCALRQCLRRILLGTFAHAACSFDPATGRYGDHASAQREWLAEYAPIFGDQALRDCMAHWQRTRSNSKDIRAAVARFSNPAELFPRGCNERDEPWVTAITRAVAHGLRVGTNEVIDQVILETVDRRQ